MVTSKSATEEPAAATKTKKETGHLNPQTFTKAYVEWWQQQQQSAMTYQRQCAEAYLDLVNNLNEIAASAQKPVLEAQNKLLAASLTSNLDQESWNKYQQLYQDLARVSQEVGNDPAHREHLQKAYQAYAEATQRALDDAHRRNTKAYQKYLGVVKDAWSHLDPENLDPENLRAIEWSTKVAFQAAGS